MHTIQNHVLIGYHVPMAIQGIPQPPSASPVIGFFLGFPDKLSKLAGRSITVKKLNSSEMQQEIRKR